MNRDIDAELQRMWKSVENQECDPRHLQYIPRNMIEELKEMLKMSTGKVAPYIVEQLRKVDRHEQEIAENDARWLDLAKSWSTGLGNISAVLRNVTSRK